MKIPIVMAASGTTSQAFDTYTYIDEDIRDRFPGHEIIWAYSSRIVKKLIKKRKKIDLKTPKQVLSVLHEKGYSWALVQSMHLIAGHEFYRLMDEVGTCRIRSSIGMPLLSSPDDYNEVVNAMQNDVMENSKGAVVMIGHGTDHPGWASYLALSSMFREKFGNRVFFGSVAGYPAKEKVVADVKNAGFKKVCLLPFMLVSGVHFQKDLAGDTDSWKTAFKDEGIAVFLKEKGIGMNRGIIDIFCRHIKEALDNIPVH